jgi:HEAT repeat protein
MGLFDFLSKKEKSEPAPSAKDIARLERLLANKLSQNYDRQDAIDALSKMGTAQSAAALLKRFDWMLDPSITDQEEKEACAKGIANAGEAALEPLLEYCKKAQSLTWPLKVLREIVPEDRVAEEMLAILDQFDTEYVRNVEPKVQLLQALQSYPSEDVRVAVEPFLADMSETVRFNAVATVFAMKDEQSVPALVAALESEESLRVKNAVAHGLAEREWTVPDELRETGARSLPPGFALKEAKVVRNA